MRLGRAVTFDDMLEAHKRARGTCEHCLNSGRIRKHVKGEHGSRIAAVYCYLALQDIQAEGMQRICEHPETKEAHWIAGASPEEWGFLQIWMADDANLCWRRAFSHVTQPSMDEGLTLCGSSSQGRAAGSMTVRMGWSSRPPATAGSRSTRTIRFLSIWQGWGRSLSVST
jgi:hypothetical protein